MDTHLPQRLAFLDHSGEMARLVRETDWSRSPLGPIDGWSPALRSAVGICLGSRFPMVLYWGPERALVYNDAWSPVAGHKHPWALGRAGREVWSEIWDIIGPMFDQVMSTGEATWSDDQLLPLNRYGYVEECYFYYSYSPVRGDDGTVEGIFTAVTETTYRVLAERRERLLRQVSEAANRARSAEEACGAAVAALTAVPQEAPFALAYLRDRASGGLRRVAVAGLDAADGLAPAQLAPGEAHAFWPFEEALRSGAAQVDGLSARSGRHLPGTPWPEPVEQALVLPIPSTRADAPHGFLVLGTSPRRRIDDDYRSLFVRAAGHVSTAIANAEAYELERQRAEQLAELDRAKTAFFSNASHEFRTPLTLMLGPVEEMLARPGPALAVPREELQLVHRNGQRLLRLVNTLLDFSRLQAGRAEAHIESLDLGPLTAEIASNFRSAMERAGLAFTVVTPSLSRPVRIDRDMWEKIVLNLLSNAFKYTLQGEVAVRLHEEEGRAILQVEDSGVGIPPHELPRVFERFHRIEGQRGRTHEGTGIGLALVQDLVNVLGGEISARSTPGRGSCFRVALPLEAGAGAAAAPPLPARPSTAARVAAFVGEALSWLPPAGEANPAGVADAAAGPVADLAAPVAPAPALRGTDVLLADDNADMRDYVARLLREAGLQVRAVPDGAAALAEARRRPPDLLLSDVMMPVLDGFGLIAAVRADPALAQLPVILLSARAGEEAGHEGRSRGADDYLVKPFSARELLARVEGALRLAALRRDTHDRLRQLNEDLERRVAERTHERDSSWNLSSDLIGVADDRGVWLSVNPAWQRTLGWTLEEIVGRTSEWMEHPDDRTRTRREIARLLRNPATQMFENRFRTADGGWRLLSWRAVARGGRLYCIARDITEERARALELDKARDSLRQSQKMEAIGQLTAGIAHDFNNMLAAVLGALELLRRKLGPALDSRGERYLQTAIQSSKRAAGLTSRLLAFGRRQSLDLQPVQLERLLAGMEDLLHRTLDENILLAIDCAPDAWTVRTDPNQLENAILNLCINARDAMPQGGRITIGVRNLPGGGSGSLPHGEGAVALAGDGVELCVSDTGIGMPAEVVEKAFDPFFTTKPLGQGTGLGLSMIHGFVNQSEGAIAIESRPGHGTQVRIRLPRFTGELLPPQAAGSTPRGRGERILIVEDEPDVRELLAEVLGEAGYVTRHAGDGGAALRILEQQEMDLLVTDVGLPGFDGRELADRARLLQPAIEVLFMTGYAQQAMARRDFLGERMQMMSKPFEVDQLVKAVHLLLNGPS